ncbi:MAG TPA: LysR family transcriptional regulator [Propionibacteriaceae bacterium]|nr:LysR family transcriptional regulator [Propionibacteriaceae bacterium]
MFTLDQVRAFVVVAEELHFGRAAERLQMTQPPLSRQVQKLERALGVRLFERDNRRVELTTAGETFLTEARRILALASGALEQAQRIQAGSAGTVRIGFTAVSTFSVLTSLLNLVSEACPDIHLDLFEMVTGEQISKLIDGELDLGLARPPFDKTAFASRLLYREDLLLAVPSDHRLSHLDRPVTAEDLVNEPLIMYSPIKARYFYDLVVRLFPITSENVVHSVSQVLTMLWLVAGGRGIAFVPASSSRLGIPGVTLRSIDGQPAQPVELHLLWSRESRNPALYTVLDCLRHAPL